MNNKNISFNHTLEEYNKKYRNRNHRLLKFTKKEVEDFDNKYPAKTKHYLLKDRKWWLIGDTYYEIPKPPRLSWYRNLNTGVQAATCILGAGVLATAVVVPTVLLLNKDGTVAKEVDVDVVAEHVKCESKMVDGNLEITLKADDGYKITGIKEIKINTYQLKDTEYKYENSKVTIAKEVLNNHSGKITVYPEVDTEGRKLTSIYVSSNPTKTKYYYKDKLDLDGLCIKSKYSDGTEEDITNNPDIIFDIEKDHEFTEADSSRTSINITYKDKTTSFSIKYYLFNEYLNVGEALMTEGTFKVSPKTDVDLPENLIIPQKITNTETNEEKYVGELSGFDNKSNIKTLDLSLIYDKLEEICEYSYGLFISNGCFKYCSSLKKVILAPGLITLGISYASIFDDCSSLEEIDCLSSTTKLSSYDDIGTGNFNRCTKLETMIIDSSNVANIADSGESTGVFDATLYQNLKTIYVNKNITLTNNSYIKINFTNHGESQTKQGYIEYRKE